jgi:PleD family two-component response regulator
MMVAERIRRTVEQYPWDTVAADLKVTVSIGVASGPDRLAVADRRLYAAKDSGRNRVTGHRQALLGVVPTAS